MNSTELSKHANSLGLIFDQGDQESNPLGSAWLVDPNTVVTCAHTIVLYKDFLPALKVRFPISNKDYAVKSVTFHPKLDQKHLIATAKRALTEPLVALALERYNVVVLKIAPGVQPLNPEENKGLNETFRAEKPDSESGLGGSLAEIELALVLQTITNARKEGTVTITDERGRVSGRLFCQQGRVSHAYFKNLVNEMAVNQIVERKVTGSFYFTSEEEPDWTSVAEINRPTDSLLIEAHRRLDELDKLAGIVGSPSSLFERLSPDPRLDALPVDCREFAKLIWPLLDGGTPLGFMWELCGIDDYSVYMTLQELIKTRQVSYFEAPFVKAGPAIPIQLGTEKSLAVGDQISALWVDDPSMAPLVRTGKILGSLTEADPAHVIHTIGLPSSASGAPIIKDELVIGIHCGALPADSAVGPTEGFHQMVWVEGIVECLNQAGEQQIVKRLTMSGEDQEITVPGVGGSGGGGQSTTRNKNAGIREVARILCPKCGRSTLEMTNFCKGCGHRLVKDQAAPKSKPKSRPPATPVVPVARPKGPPVMAAFIMALIAIIGGLGAMNAMPQPNIVVPLIVTQPAHPWVTTSVQLFDESARRWTEALPSTTFLPGNKVCIDAQAKRLAYLYCFYRGQSGSTSLMFPSELRGDKMMKYDEAFSIGDNRHETDRNSQNGFEAMEFDGDPGVEQFVFVMTPARLVGLDSGPAALVPAKDTGAAPGSPAKPAGGNPGDNTPPAWKANVYKDLVDRCLNLIGTYNCSTGLQTTVEQLDPGCKNFKPGIPKPNGTPDIPSQDDVFISSVKLDHARP